MRPVLLEHEAKLRDLQASLAQVRIRHLASSAVLLMGVALFLTIGLLAVRHRVPFWWPLLPIPFAAVSAVHYRRHRREQSRLRRLKRFYQRAVARMEGAWQGEGFTGNEFNDAEHIYARDLGIFGEGSVFELLCTARTAIGRRGLADYLLLRAPVEETLLRQEAVRELRGMVNLRESVALLGDLEFFESKWETFTEWLGAPAFPFSRSLRIAASITSGLMAGAVLAAALGFVPWLSAAMWIAPLAAFHTGVGLTFRKRVNRMVGWLHPVSVEARVFREGLRLLGQQQFQSLKLRQLVDRVRGGARSVRTLERLLNALHERNREWFYGPSLVLLVGTQLCMAIEHWRTQHQAGLLIWLSAWAEFEALSALANYAWENPENAFPEFLDSGACFEAKALGHPLLPADSCVPNDVCLNRQSRFYIVSGSNMSGKSTLLRAIGLNTVLAFAGTAVRARQLRLSPLSVCASLSVVDSLLNGKSKFLAEVDRLRRTLETAAAGQSALFLIDEIFSGTNSRDRRAAAEAVVRSLIARGAIGALSTHDLALTEIAAAEELHGVNVHTGSRDGSDPMDFDYLLKPGVTTEANALSIARMAGVPV